MVIVNNAGEVKVVALKPLPYNKIRRKDEVFYARKGFADLFVRQGLARLGTADDKDPEPANREAPRLTRALVTETPKAPTVIKKKASKRKNAKSE